MDKQAILAAVLLLASPAIQADDAADAEAKIREYFDADAHQQFDAVWHYIQSLPDAPDN